MAEPIIMPKLGFDMAEGTLVNWTVKPGDEIKKGAVIAEIETDKATLEIESTVEGTLLNLLAEPGDVVAVGTALGYVGAPGEQPPEGSAGAAPAAAAPAEEAAPAAQPGEAELKPQGEAQATITDKAAVAPPAGAPGHTQDVEAGEARTEQTEAQATPLPSAEQAAPPPAGDGQFPGGVKASPVARRLAEERGVDLRQVKGSGPGGRVTKSDVEGFQPSATPAAPAAAPAPQQPAAPAPTAARPAGATYGELPSGPDVVVEDMSRMRARIGQRMLESKQLIPHFYVTTDIDMDAALALRQQINATIEDEAERISVNDLVVKATALALRQFPNLNSHYYGDKIVRNQRINIGIAVALPQGGLINVTAYDADKTALGTMARTNRDMILRAREGKVKPEEISNSTFSVSNLGPYDVDHFIAIINPPEAGILAVGSASKVPVVKDDGTLGVGTRMKVTISVDHRVSDGAEGAEYMQLFKQLLENPMRLLI